MTIEQNRMTKRTCLAVVMMAGATIGLSGCTETDSFMYDPSVIGRWERTPTRVPILNRVPSIEGMDEDGVEVSDASAADLMPEVIEYRIGPGDRLSVTVFDLPEEGRSIDYIRFVDPRGFIDLPQIGQVYVSGLTSSGAEEAVKTAMKAFITRPMSAINVDARRADRYSIMGAVQNPGQFALPTANFKLLEALSSSGTFSEAGEFIYVIRQVPLSDAVSGRPSPGKNPTKDGVTPEKTGEGLLNAIDRLNQPEPPKNPEPKKDKPAGSPGMFQPGTTQPASQPEKPKQPPVDLVPRPGDKPKAAGTPAAAAQPDSGEMTWVNIDGKWVKVKKPASSVETPSPLGRPAPGDALVTQRIIRIPLLKLVSGDARYNIIVRSGDVIRVAPSPAGTVYVEGQVGRPGAYNLAEHLTLQRIIPSAGGLGGLAKPERVDLTRMVGPDHQATIRVDLRAIKEGTNPDILLKANDLINVGTSFWALPMAVIRNGFRFTYGFGFLADRNFGNDIFGAPPTNFGQ